MRNIYKDIYRTLCVISIILFVSIMPVFAAGDDAGMENTGAANASTGSADNMDDAPSEGNGKKGIEIVKVELDKLPEEEIPHYIFLYGFQALLEEKCNGALLTRTADNEYIAGWLSPDAPDDFCVRIAPDMLIAEEPVVKDLAIAMYTMLGDRLAVSTLTASEEEYFKLMIMFRPEKDMVLTPIWYAESENAIEDSAIAFGMNPETFYSIMASQGYDKPSLIASVAQGVKADTIIGKALEISSNIAEENSRMKTEAMMKNIIFSVAFMIIVILLTVVVFVIVTAVLKKKNGNSGSEIEEDDEDDFF